MMDVARSAEHSHAERQRDLAEAEEHINALEDAIRWCVINRAIVGFNEDAVYVRARQGGTVSMYTAPTLIEAIELATMGTPQ